ncbi:hypothetical protein AOQ84DRAFT_382626, partial [Glonium stellatum]
MEIDRTKQLEDLVHKVGLIGRARSESISDYDFAHLHTELSNLVLSGSGLLMEQKILAGLRFKQIKVRYSDIPEAHANTFRWIFQTPETPKPSTLRIKFLGWMEQSVVGQDIYWVGGKPGSGKSTLMKFICDHPRTKKALQEGLLQTLLYEILRKFPNLIREILPQRWSNTDQEPWTHVELLEAFRKLQHVLKSSARFCFFIDGLDECGGEPQDILEILREFSTFGNVRMCVSSRPWLVFTLAFDDHTDRRLYLQDLTRDDIALYVRNKLIDDPTFAQARKKDDRYQELVVEIVERAQGVFFWVFLVVRSLLDGLTNADTLKTLQTRLRRLPTDLEAFFQHILDSIDDLYQPQMGRTFQVALAGMAPLLLLLYSVLDDLEYESAFTLKLKMRPHDDYYVTARETLDTKTNSNTDIAVRENDMQKRIAART